MESIILLKKIIILFLSRFCIHRWGHCNMAKWSDALDQKWGTKIWKEVDDSE